MLLRWVLCEISVVWELRKVVSEWREGLRAKERVWELKRLSDTSKKENKSQLGPTCCSWRAVDHSWKSSPVDSISIQVIHMTRKRAWALWDQTRNLSPVNSISMNKKWVQLTRKRAEHWWDQTRNSSLVDSISMNENRVQ